MGDPVRKLGYAIAAWLVVLVVVVLRLTCRLRGHRDPRPALRSRSQPYIYSVLHAHQVAAIVGSEAGTGAMVSRSADGGLIVPVLRTCGVVPFRGSGRRHGQDKGGLTALSQLTEHVQRGCPAYLAVDGPRGPRNHVQKGIAVLSQRTNAAVINVVPVPQRRWIIARAWDRLQIPHPFTTIDYYFGEPIYPRPEENAEQYRQRIESAICRLEEQHDPAEAHIAQRAVERK